ncbi:MAG: BCCT family transporter [Hyphomicrobiaceae bacterium]
MFKINPLLIVALIVTGSIAIWGIVDTENLAQWAAETIEVQFSSRAWFIMLTVSGLLIVSLFLAISKYGEIKLGADDDQPEFSTVSWLSMLFAAGMGVGLLYWGTAEPLTHYLAVSEVEDSRRAADAALFITNFHWGMHAWAIYALTGLVIAYFGFRLDCPNLVSAPLIRVYGKSTVTMVAGWLFDLMAIVAIAIGVGGSIAMGVFQIKGGIDVLMDVDSSGTSMSIAIFLVLCVAYTPPLLMDLSRGMAILSNTAMAIACGLMVFVLIAGPTQFIMGGIIGAIGEYVSQVVVHGFRTYTFMDERTANWFHEWTLTYMVWWLAWAPFVGVFIARISKGRTIREFLFGVIVVPTVFSIFWFGVFGSIGFYAALRTNLPILELVQKDASRVMFFVLEQFPASRLTISAVVAAAFLFLITSVVSAAFVLGMFSSSGSLNPSRAVKLGWGVILGALGLVMILSDSIAAIKSIIALGALPFVFVVTILVICLLRALAVDEAAAIDRSKP